MELGLRFAHRGLMDAAQRKKFKKLHYFRCKIDPKKCPID